MKKIFPLIVILITFGCNTNQESNTVVSASIDSVTTKTDQQEKKFNNNVIDFYSFLKSQPLKLVNEELFELPGELKKEEDGTYNLYDFDIDEGPIGQAILSSNKKKLIIHYGDYHVSILNLPACSKENFISVVVSNFMGNYSDYSLYVFKVADDNKVSDVTSEVIKFEDFNKSFTDLNNLTLALSDYQFSLQENGSLNIKLNESKLSPVYLNSNGKAAIGKTSEKQRNLNLSMNWSLSDCKYIIK